MWQLLSPYSEPRTEVTNYKLQLVALLQRSMGLKAVSICILLPVYYSI